MREFNPQILRAFGLKSKTVKRAFGAHICDTNKGLKMVKTVNIPVECILFIHSAKEHLNRQGFSNIDRFNESNLQSPYYEYNKNIYVVKDWIDGEECDFTDFKSVKWATENLANMHLASVGMKPLENSRISNKLGLIPEALEKHYRELTYMYKKVRKSSRWNDFDILFIKNYNDYFEDACYAKEIMNESSYAALIQQAKDDKVFCHDKFTNHNLQVAKGKMMVINFEHCCYKLPLNDLLRFFEKVMRKCDWDQKKGFEILDIYSRTKGLSDDELKVFYAMLLFPDKFWRLSNQHYNTRRHWMPKIYSVKMNELIYHKEVKKDFLNSFKRNL